MHARMDAYNNVYTLIETYGTIVPLSPPAFRRHVPCPSNSARTYIFGMQFNRLSATAANAPL